MNRYSVLWIAAGLMFQAVLLAGVALLSRPASVLPGCAGLSAWFGSSRDTIVGQGRALARPLPEGDMPSEACDLEVPPEYRGQLQSGQVEGFVRALEHRLGLLQRRIEQAWRNPRVGREVVSDNILIDKRGTFAHIYHYYGKVCDGVRRLQLDPDADTLPELRARVLHDYAAACRALEVAECPNPAPVRPDKIASAVLRPGTTGDQNTLQEPALAADPDAGLTRQYLGPLLTPAR